MTKPFTKGFNVVEIPEEQPTWFSLFTFSQEQFEALPSMYQTAEIRVRIISRRMVRGAEVLGEHVHIFVFIILLCVVSYTLYTFVWKLPTTFAWMPLTSFLLFGILHDQRKPFEGGVVDCFVDSAAFHSYGDAERACFITSLASVFIYLQIRSFYVLTSRALHPVQLMWCTLSLIPVCILLSTLHRLLFQLKFISDYR